MNNKTNKKRAVISKKHSTWTYLRAMLKVGKRSFELAPGIAIVKITDSIIQAVLPIITTFFAAITTTALVEAYAGDSGASNRAILFVVITATLGILSMLWRGVSDYISRKMRYTVESSIEDEMMLKFTGLPFASYDDKSVVELYEKARRFSYFFSYIFDSVSSMIGAVIGSITAIIALLIISPWLSLIILISVVPGAIIQLQLARQQTRHWDKNFINRRKQGDIGWMIQQPQFIAEMRVYGVIQHLISEYARFRDKDIKGRMDFELKSSLRSLIADVGTAIVELGSLIWITLEIINRHQPVGQFIYVQQMVGRAFGEAGGLASQLGRIDEDLANITQFQEFMELDTDQDDGREIGSMSSGISVEQVSFKYPGTEVLALDSISMSIERGSRVAIVGENGAGKSTLVKILMGLYKPTSGRIMVDGHDLDTIKIASWHKQVALLSQQFVQYIFATMRENVALGDIRKQATDEMILQAMEKAEFTEVVNKLPHGMNTYIERWLADEDQSTATELSGGQSQRLAMARNFYRNAPIIILDEPTSAIDALAESRIFKRLFSLPDKTLIIVSHRLSTVKRADVVYMMEQGKVVESGTHDELVVKKGRYYRMFESQITK